MLIATIGVSTFTVFLLRPSGAGPSVTTFEYRAKWICNIPLPVPTAPQGSTFVNLTAAENIGLVPGEYKTDINVHNPSHSANITILKKFVVSTPETAGPTTPVTRLARITLFPDGAIFMDCVEILNLFTSAVQGIAGCNLFVPSCALKGFVVINQVSSSGTVIGFSSDRLDVVGEYSSESFNTTFTGNPPAFARTGSTGISLDVEPIPASPFVA
jgi:hypothetical protein